MSRSRQGITVAVVFCCAAAARPQDEGVKKVEQLVRKAKATVQSIESTKSQLAKTMEVYNALMANDATNRKGTYKKLQQQMAATDQQRAEILFRAAEMDAEAEAMFKSWAETIDAIEDAGLRQRSEERLAGARTNQAQIKVVGRKAAELYVPVMQTLRNQVTYLGHDLNVFAIASLKTDADKLNRDVRDLVERIDDTVGAANAAIAALHPR